MRINDFLKCFQLKEEGFESLEFKIESADFIYTLNQVRLYGKGWPQSIGPETKENLDIYLSNPDDYWISDITNHKMCKNQRVVIESYEYPITMEEIQKVISVLIKHNISFDITYKDYLIMSDIRLMFIKERQPRKHWRELWKDEPLLKDMRYNNETQSIS